jgi:hypothetical protein
MYVCLKIHVLIYSDPDIISARVFSFSLLVFRAFLHASKNKIMNY